MKFRLGYATAIDDRVYPYTEPLRIVLGHDDGTQVTFRRRTSEELERKQPGAKDVLIIAERSYSVRQEIEELLSCLERRQLPPGAVSVPESRGFLDTSGMIKERHVVPIKAMPQHYKNFQSDVYNDLHRSIHRTFRLVRWRYNLKGPHNPLQLALDIQYSRDGQNWIAASFTLTGSIEIEVVRPIGGSSKELSDIAQQVGHLSETAVDEPTAHALFREAWEQRGQNRRSALVMGIAAAEVGLKECIVHLCPETRWLLENTPSPPVDKMLVRYWKELPKMPLANGQPLRIPRKVVKDLASGIELRNKIVHRGDAQISREVLQNILESVRDLLFMFDCAKGHFWAIEYVRLGSQREIVSQG